MNLFHYADEQFWYEDGRLLLRGKNHDVISVCENPSIMASAAEKLQDQCRPMICVEGFPSHAATMSIDGIAGDRVAFRYHGDFDASGLRIAAQMIVGRRMTPWRMSATDYETAATKSTLDLSPTQPIPDTPRDPALRQAVYSHGKAVLEEIVADDLLADLKR